MKVYIKSILKDVYFTSNTFDGKTYESYKLQLFNPDGTNAENRNPTLTINKISGDNLNLNDTKYVESLLNKEINLTCDFSVYNDKIRLTPVKIN